MRFGCDSLPVGGAPWANHYRLIFMRVSRARLQRCIRGGLRGGFSGLARTVVRLINCQTATGSLAAKRPGRAPGTAGKLARHIGFLTGIVGAEPDITLRDLTGALARTHGVPVHLFAVHLSSIHLSSIHRALAKADLIPTAFDFDSLGIPKGFDI